MNKDYINFFLNSKFSLLLIVNIMFFILCSYILPLRFEENDDIVMLLFASGKYTGTPEPYLVFINYIYGLFLSFLYTLTGKIEWYTILFAIIHVFSLTVIVWCITKKDIKSIYKVLFVIIFYVIEIRIILLFQFTTTAAIGSLAGVALIINEKHYQKIFGIIFLIISSLIRIEACFLVLLVVSPVFIPLFFKNKRIIFNKTGVYLFISVTSMLFCKYIDYRIVNKDVDWSYYNEYNKLRGQINDNPNADSIIDNLPLGISKTDYQLVLNFLSDSKIIDLTKISLINDSIKKVGFTQKIKNIYPSLRAYTLVLFLIIIIWFFIFFGTVERQNKIMQILSLLIFVFSLCYISFEGSLKYRIFITALLPFIFVMIVTFEKRDYKMFKVVICFTVISFIILFSYRTFKICNLRNKLEITEFAEQKNLLDNYLKYNNNSVLLYESDFSIEFYPAFNVSRLFNSKQIIFSGWSTSIPFDKKKYDSHLDLVNKNALFIRKKALDDIKYLIITGIKNNYNIKVIPKIEAQSKNYIILKLYKK